MPTGEQELESLQDQIEDREAGVADLMELYEKVEGIYIEAAISTSETEDVHSANSTSTVNSGAYLG